MIKYKVLLNKDSFIVRAESWINENAFDESFIFQKIYLNREEAEQLATSLNKQFSLEFQLTTLM